MTAPTSIIFCGTPDFAVPSLALLASDPRFKVQLVVTQPDKPVGRSQSLTPPPVKVAALEYGIDVLQPAKLGMEIPTLEQLHPDFLVVVAYGQILSDAVLAIPRIAAVNVHPSLLPRWRGASPLQHAILAGDRESGVSIQRIVAELDAGPILAQEKFPMPPDITTPRLSSILAERGARLLAETLASPLHEVQQNEAEVTVCKKLSRVTGIVDLQTMTAEEIDRKVRALNPWPGVTCELKGVTVKLLETALEGNPSALTINCKDSTTLSILKLQVPGGKPMTGEEWIRGRR